MRRSMAFAAVVVSMAVLVPAAPVQAAPRTDALSWGACPPPSPNWPHDPRLRCATVQVPLDYRDPRAGTIGVAVSRLPSTDPARRRGVLLANPGGPGGDGVDMPSYLAMKLPAEVLARYDLIGFDPRGVRASTPVTCGLTAFPADLVLPYPAPDGSIDRNVAFARDTARACAANGGPVLARVTTANTARDMDRIRAALGERTVSYLGFSYGTYLGAVYASLFPGRTDRIILDSALDPNRIWYDTWRNFSIGMVLRLPDFTAWAARRDATYHLGSTSNAVRQQYLRIAAALDRQPIVRPDLVLDGNVFREITRGHMYDDRLFPELAEIWQGLSGVGAPASPHPAARLDVTADNPIAVLYAIACNDIAWSRDVGGYAARVAVDRRVFPITAGMPANLWPCAMWHARPAEPPVRITSAGPRNILILQNLRDPATPWIGGVGLRTALGHRAAFVTQDAGGHGIYAIRSGACTDAIATAFLVTGTLPTTDRFCAGPSPEDVTPQAAADAVPLWTPGGPLG